MPRPLLDEVPPNGTRGVTYLVVPRALCLRWVRSIG